MKLSALVVAHNEEARLAACLEKLAFADELVVVCDKCTDGTKAVAERFGAKTLEGSWDIEGDRRNKGIEACSGDWILEVDADEHVPADLAAEIRRTIETSRFDWHEILVDNYIGDRLVRHGWGASYGKAAYPGLFKKGAKVWGRDRVHPSLRWTGTKGPMLSCRLNHYVDRNISDMIRRLDSYSTAKARDLRERGETWGGTAANTRRMVSRFFKCYVRRKGWKEGGHGFIIAVCAALYPMLSHLKAKHEKD
ncbi:Glycosyltransferases involved in cell wall biogenesis [Magnetospirillum sp. LM-5]|uniref:glycosyltransferase family 2 protein n=1 Tax=Magnetospirillum sp. LM-5 TaxID=2681466 RepID=UPI00137DA930|nr:glycosyltransferase family 2 protein [Magnetospirillum sp. LM-5]CAA7619435.1 Glycosyltransferases involved in cell wall biogenesis [Magnetospirillum sp. LM-5]